LGRGGSEGGGIFARISFDKMALRKEGKKNGVLSLGNHPVYFPVDNFPTLRV